VPGQAACNTAPGLVDTGAPRCRASGHALAQRKAKSMTIQVATLGFPRIGPRRELKYALESYWSG
jgi:hypothetical protein